METYHILLALSSIILPAALAADLTDNNEKGTLEAIKKERG